MSADRNSLVAVQNSANRTADQASREAHRLQAAGDKAGAAAAIARALDAQALARDIGKQIVSLKGK